MRIALRAVGVLLLLMGIIWFLQGANVLTAGTSFMEPLQEAVRRRGVPDFQSQQTPR